MEKRPPVNFRSSDLEKKNFLIIDDFGDMRGMIKGMLQGIGVTRLDVAANGKDAVSAMEAKRYDFILCDYNLGPGKNGQQVLEEARYRNLIGLGSVFIMITAENTLDMVMGAVEYEPDSYLTKPFTKDLLRVRLNKMVEKKKNLQDVEQAVDCKDFEVALVLLDKKIAEKPRNLRELIKLKTELCFRTGDYQQAATMLEEVIAEREIPWALLGLGKVHYARGDFEKSRALFEKLLLQNERFTAAYDWLARTLQMLDRYEDAQEVLHKAVTLSPHAILRQQALGVLAMKNQDEETAAKALANAVKLGRHSVYKHPSVNARLAKIRVRMGAGREGLKILKNMLSEFPDSEEASLYASMAECVIHSDAGDKDAAEASFQRTVELYEQIGLDAGPEAALEMVRVCDKLGDSDKAKNLLHTVVKNNHSEDWLLRDVGNLMSELGLDLDPESYIKGIHKEVVNINNQGVELAKSGRLKQALDHFEEAAQGMPANKVVNLNAARVLIMNMKENGVGRGQLGKVKQYLERVRKLDDEDPGLRRVHAMYRQLSLQS